MIFATAQVVEFLKQNWFEIVLTIAAIIVALFLYARQQSLLENTDAMTLHQKAEAARIQKQIDDTKQASGAIEEELKMLRSELVSVKEDIAESVKKREELHDAISKARTIRDIDRILSEGSGSR